MKFYLLVVLSLAAFIFQIIFSFFYSSQMVELNYSYNQNQKKLNQLQIQNQDLKLQLANLTSSEFLLKNSSGLSPIIQTLP